MKKIDNPYSKYRYSNTYTPKFRVEDGTTRIYGTELRAFKNQIEAQMPDVPSTWVDNGATWVVNHVFRSTQVNKVDGPMPGNKNAPKRIFFKLFKL